jgi:hypothetical protein
MITKYRNTGYRQIDICRKFAQILNCMKGIFMFKRSCCIIIKDHPVHLDKTRIYNTISKYQIEGYEVFIYLLDEGILFLQSEYWPLLQSIDCIIYACGHGSQQYNVPFREEVIFTGIDSLAQLIKSSNHVIPIQKNEKEIINKY